METGASVSCLHIIDTCTTNPPCKVANPRRNETLYSAKSLDGTPNKMTVTSSPKITSVNKSIQIL